MNCKTCGKELGYVDDSIGETLGLVCINPKCSENGLIV